MYFQIMLFVALAQVLNYVHAPFVCAASYAGLSAVALYILQVPLQTMVVVIFIRFVVAYVIYRILEHYEDNVFIWWWVLVLGGVALYKGEEYLIGYFELPKIF